MMRVLITGIDGYLGWSLAQHLAARGHIIAGADAFLRRKWVEEMGSVSAIPIASIEDRIAAFGKRFDQQLAFVECDFRDHSAVVDILEDTRPDVVVHLAECPSAPYSMIDVAHASFVQVNNVTSTLNLLFAMRDVCHGAHLVKLGTMGEYGTPNVDIPEGFFDIEYRGRRDRLPFPRQAGSWYHWSKVFDSQNVHFACQLWGLRATDVMQSVVYGTHVPDDPRLATRLDFDEAFGTAVHRLCCQVVAGYPLTQYGSGMQRRGFLSLADSMQCLTLAIEHPPSAGEYRVFNQLRDVLTIGQLVDIVRTAAASLGFDVHVEPVQNPRCEAEGHYYNPDSKHLRTLGFVPTESMEDVVKRMINDLTPHRARILSRAHLFSPAVLWNRPSDQAMPYMSALPTMKGAQRER